MDYKIQSDNSVINLNNIILEEVQSSIQDFLKKSLTTIQKNSGYNNVYFTLLFSTYRSKYINQNFVYKFPTIKSDNIFHKFFTSIKELFDTVLSINIMDKNYQDHLKLITLLNYIRRLIYENKYDYLGSSDEISRDEFINNKSSENDVQGRCNYINISRRIPCSLKKDKYSNIIKNYGSYFGIINLLEKLEWIIVDHNNDIYFSINKKVREKINCDEQFVLSLEKMLHKLEGIYNSISKIENLIIEMFSFNDAKLAELLGTETNNRYFIMWKICLGFNKYRKVNELKKIDLLRSNYEDFISNYDPQSDNYSKKKLIKEFSVDSKKKVIYEGII